MNFDILEKLTVLFLAGFFIFAELYFAQRKEWGIVKKISTSPSVFFDVAPKELEVLLPDGVVITVEASPCVFCSGNFSVGDKVRLTKLGKKYFLSLSFVSGIRKQTKCLSTSRRETEPTC